MKQSPARQNRILKAVMKQLRQAQPLLLLFPLQILAGSFTGLWQGPHPELSHSSFILHLQEERNGGIIGEGYWADQNIVTSRFPVDSIWIRNHQIHIGIKEWGCVYVGESSPDDLQLHGRFECAGEEPDSVALNRISGENVYGIFPDHLNNDGSFRYEYRIPPQEEGGLETADRENLSIDGEVLSQMVREVATGHYGEIHALLMVKNGRLISENYFYGFHKDVLHPVESVTKSITSLLIGILRDQSRLPDLSVTVSGMFSSTPGLCSADMEKIHLTHLLTMTSQVAGNQEKMLFSQNRKNDLLGCTLKENPGSLFLYQAWNTEVLGLIIREISGMFADRFAEVHLFSPLDIATYHWETFRNNGYPLCGGALWLRPRDMAKIGQLVLDNGKWMGKQIISRDWIQESTRGHVRTGIDQDRYGYQWWISDIRSGAQTYQLIWANGLGSQFIFILPELNMVVAVTGGNWEGGNEGRSWDIIQMLEKYLYALNRPGT